MVNFLLQAGADQEHKTDEMHTALMEASMDGHVEVAKLLLDSGAQVSIVHVREDVFTGVAREALPPPYIHCGPVLFVCRR